MVISRRHEHYIFCNTGKSVIWMRDFRGLRAHVSMFVVVIIFIKNIKGPVETKSMIAKST